AGSIQRQAACRCARNARRSAEALARFSIGRSASALCPRTRRSRTRRRGARGISCGLGLFSRRRGARSLWPAAAHGRPHRGGADRVQRTAVVDEAGAKISARRAGRMALDRREAAVSLNGTTAADLSRAAARKLPLAQNLRLAQNLLTYPHRSETVC